jgi:hypothetical protein
MHAAPLTVGTIKLTEKLLVLQISHHRTCMDKAGIEIELMIPERTAYMTSIHTSNLEKKSVFELFFGECIFKSISWFYKCLC